MTITLDRVSGVMGCRLHTVFKSKTRPNALKQFKAFYLGQYAHDLDTDRSQIPASWFRIDVCRNNQHSIMTFSNRQLVDLRYLYDTIESMIMA